MKTTLTDFTSLLNSSITNATFPPEWKKALLRPLAKTKTPRLPSDTRPIALLSECSKVFERLIHDQLSGYLEVHNLLSPRQAGFRRGHSTQTALLGVLEDVRQAIDDRMLTILIIFDFSKAFDSIPHARLLSKLRAMNMSDHALRWFFNYLADRLQAVIDEGGSVSDWLRASSGVPQGSVLGLRFVVGRLPFRAHVIPHLLSLGWLSALKRREYFVGILAYTIVARNTPAYLVHRLRRRQNVDVFVRRSERHPPQAFVPLTPRTEAFKHSFILEAMSLLNSISVTEFSIALLPHFKNHLFNLLFERDMADWARRVRIERLSAGLANVPRARL